VSVGLRKRLRVIGRPGGGDERDNVEVVVVPPPHGQQEIAVGQGRGMGVLNIHQLALWERSGCIPDNRDAVKDGRKRMGEAGERELICYA
jgi:hypothetical protein